MRADLAPEFYRQLFEHSEDAVLFTVPDGRILAANPAACRMLGRSEEDIVRVGRPGIVDESDPHLLPALQERERTGRARVELNFMRVDGSRFPGEMTSAIFIDDDGQPRTAMIVRDISKRKELEREREQYLKFFMLSADPMCIADPFGCFRHVNHAFEQLTGYSEADLISKPFLDFIVSEDRQRTADEMKLQVSVRPSLHFENRYRCKDDSVVLLSWTAYFDKSDAVTYATARNITEIRRLEDHARQMNDIMLCVRRINEHLLVAQDETALYQFVCDALTRVGNVVGAWFGAKHPDFTLEPVTCSGVDLATLQGAGLRWDEDAAGRSPSGLAILQRRPIILVDTELDERFGSIKASWREAGIRSVLSVPVTIDGEVAGVLAIWSSRAGTFDQETVQFLVEVAGDIGVGVRSIQLNKRLTATLGSLRETLESTVEAIATMVEFRDPYTAGHQRRVADLSAAIGREMGLPEKRIEGLRVIGYLHDVGKISVPAELLSKPSKLTETEYSLIQEHPELGYRILKNLSFSWPVADAVRQHHERLDGSGYPAGLKGDDIVLEARILAVADTVEAMASHRPYRPGLGIERATEEIVKGRGKYYDPQVVDAFVRLIRDRQYVLPEYGSVA
jgi:PAS domain S-box-containing protein/putative nucleotidyltransferase with HDIG domain